MSKYTTTPDAMQLLLEGQLALSTVESSGVRIDKTYLETALTDTTKKIRDLESEITSDPIYHQWQKRFGDKTNIAAPAQLAWVVFNELGYKVKVETDSGERASASEKALEGIDIPLVKNYLRSQKLRRLHGTYLGGIQREMVEHDGYWWVHPSYNLNMVSSFRSSCWAPNWQNVYKRDPEFMEMVRRCYLPRRGYQITEHDLGQIECRVPCFYHCDPNLMAYVSDPNKDMHRDMAMQIFKLKKHEVSKAVRHVAKNQGVFPLFYGSYYAQCAPLIWNDLIQRNLKVEGTDTTVIEHLAAQGITELGACDSEITPRDSTFEKHLKNIEDDFWGRRFKVYAQWKRDWYDAYLENGGFLSLTGFAWNMVLDRKQVCNMPIQSVAFHCFLWGFIRVVRRFRKYRMQSRGIGEIHDAMQNDTHPKERNAVCEIVQEVMTKELPQAWKFINVPITCEHECCPVDGSWADLSTLTEKNGNYVPVKLPQWEEKFGPWSLQEAV